MVFIPMVSESNESYNDIVSVLLSKRILLLNGDIDPLSSNLIISQLLYLNSINPDQDISLYINSLGGSISSGLCIYNTMNYINNDVSTLVYGNASSVAGVILAGGTKGKRYALPNAEIMLHQPLGEAYGQVSNIMITSDRINTLKEEIYKVLSICCNHSLDKIANDLDRDLYFTPKEASEYGIIDSIINKKA